ncbi:gliding motility-associated ABC transporter substrate-binding protein GldG [Flavobacterium orientale]|uniref:Gliding motility-associated ABC transporter substrate-binding protein GldG n=1 Tax=Flavobacterium orientale TaxID=1756020 RepID=A0A917DBL9_9FLAO|nr:gliding motility-associated ABC transporter substrate-binding protein GldG [Flavobacterium orientale]GGD26263.1 gliding motility-associated ABC transporter substrate-binding protein GldG [Flavobacterium orientale]
MKKINKKLLINWLSLVAILIVINIISSYFFKRFDLTADKRYTLSEHTLELLASIEQPLFIDVFLDGNFPSDIKRLQVETRQLLEEFKAYNSNIQFQFINPLAEEGDKNALIDAFYEKGMTPINITVEDKGKQSQEIVFPWAIAYSGEKDTKVPLLKNMMGASTEEKVISSVQHLEYAFANAIATVSKEKSKKVVVLKGNGQPEDVFIGDALKQIRDNYFIAPFTLDSVAANPEKVLKQLQGYDLAIMVKPTERFSDEEKLVLDQYVMSGGKMLWLMDMVSIEMDSLYNDTGTSLAYPKDLNLNDLFFKYGVRINPYLIKDIMATPISLATGAEGSATQYKQFPWFYAPMIYPSSKHPIVANLDGLKFEFTNPIDTLKNDIQKTVLLQSSPYSKGIGTPIEVSLEMVSERPEPTDFQNSGLLPVAVLLEGNFKSAFQNRVLPFKTDGYKETGTATKMIVVSDGDVIKNQLDKNYQPLELGYDKWTNTYYGNKEFILNSVNFLLDDSGLINIRSKEVNLPLLDKEKVYDNYSLAQWITIGVPITIVVFFGLLFIYIRKRIYGK